MPIPPPPATSPSAPDADLTGAQIKANALRLADDIRSRDLASDFDRHRKLPAAVVEQLRSAGVFRMNMPAAWGGPEMTSMDQVEVIEALSAADASVGWCSFIWTDSGIYSGYLDDAVARALYPRLDMAQSGWVYPAVMGERVSDGYRLTGRWIFGSGSNHCDLLAAGFAVTENGKPILDQTGKPEWRIALAKPSAFTIEDTWYTTGLRGTGSNDYTAEALVVPDEHTFAFSEPHRTGPLWRRPDTLLRKMAGVPLGLARECIDDAVRALEGKLDRRAGTRYTQERAVQGAIAAAEADWSAARAYVFQALETQWAKLESGAPLTLKERADTGLSRQFAFQMARRVAQSMYDAIGGASVYAKNPFDRHLRDAMTACQHIVAQQKTAEDMGALLLGEEDRFGLI